MLVSFVPSAGGTSVRPEMTDEGVQSRSRAQNLHDAHVTRARSRPRLRMRYGPGSPSPASCAGSDGSSFRELGRRAETFANLVRYGVIASFPTPSAASRFVMLLFLGRSSVVHRITGFVLALLPRSPRDCNSSRRRARRTYGRCPRTIRRLRAHEVSPRARIPSRHTDAHDGGCDRRRTPEPWSSFATPPSTTASRRGAAAVEHR